MVESLSSFNGPDSMVMHLMLGGRGFTFFYAWVAAAMCRVRITTDRDGLDNY